MKEEYHKWHTQYLDREFNMLVFGHAGYPVILFPTSKARYYETKDFGLIDSLSPLIDSGRIKIFCPDGVDYDSWYNYSIPPADRVLTHIAYEKTILNDVIEFAKVETGLQKVALAGCSFGAYHSLNLAFRYPELVSYLFCLSGAYDIKQFIMGYYDDNCYFNNPPDYMYNLTEDTILNKIRQIGIILGTGTEDPCLEENLRMSRLLSDKHINHWLDVRPGFVHDWNFWKEMLPGYLAKIDY